MTLGRKENFLIVQSKMKTGARDAAKFTGGCRMLVTPFLSEAGGEVTAYGVCRSLGREEKGEDLDKV